MIDRELEGKLAGELDRVRRFLAGGWMGNRNGGRVIGRGLDGKAWLEGKLAGAHFRGLEGKIVFWGTKMLAGSCCEGVFSGRGMAGETIFV